MKTIKISNKFTSSAVALGCMRMGNLEEKRVDAIIDTALENGINFNGNAEIAILLTEEELDGFANAIPENCKTIYLGHDVLPSEEQEKIFKKNGITINVIPDYYYRDLEA